MEFGNLKSAEVRITKSLGGANMIKVIAIICCILGPIFLGLWAATQVDEHNAHSLALHNNDWKKYEEERKARRFFGWAGLIMSIIGLIYMIGYTTH